MKNRTLVLNDLLKMKESNLSLHEMTIKLQHYGLSYYEGINLLNEVTKNSLEDLSELLLKEQYWINIKNETDKKEQILHLEYEEMKSCKIEKKHKFDEHIQEAYQTLLDNKKAKNKKFRNLDKSLIDLFKSV